MKLCFSNFAVLLGKIVSNGFQNFVEIGHTIAEYCLSIFKIAAVHRLGFPKFQIFSVRSGSGVIMQSPYLISSKLVKLL